MSLLRASNISASGLTAERERIEVIASNLANARATRSPEGGPYRRRDVVFQAVALPESFESHLAGELNVPLGVKVAEVVVDKAPPREVFDPGHPDADARGYVSLPNVDPAEEMVNLIAAARAFEANVAAVEITRQLLQRSLELGR
jgi:flagellar basal-body rod protein FlgC